MPLIIHCLGVPDTAHMGTQLTAGTADGRVVPAPARGWVCVVQLVKKSQFGPFIFNQNKLTPC